MRIILCNTLHLPTLLYGSENWTTGVRDATRITATEMERIQEQQDTLGQIMEQIQRLRRN
jgi:hypothetical protein